MTIYPTHNPQKLPFTQTPTEPHCGQLAGTQPDAEPCTELQDSSYLKHKRKAREIREKTTPTTFLGPNPYFLLAIEVFIPLYTLSHCCKQSITTTRKWAKHSLKYYLPMQSCL